MKTYRIAVIPGDGTGPEVVAEAVKVLDAAAAQVRLQARADAATTSAASATCAPARSCPTASLDGAAQVRRDPARRHRPSRRQARASSRRASCCALRFELDQYINLRPVQALSRASRRRSRTRGPRTSTSSSCARTPGTLHRRGRRRDEGHARTRWRCRSCVNTRSEVERCLRYAFEYARKTARRRERRRTRSTLVRQDQRAHLRLRPLGARLPRDRREGLPRHQARLRPRRRHLHVDGEEPRVVRRDRHRATCSATSSPTSAP